jgi:hypothetical protein
LKKEEKEEEKKVREERREEKKIIKKTERVRKTFIKLLNGKWKMSILNIHFFGINSKWQMADIMPCFSQSLFSSGFDFRLYRT